MFSKQTLHFLSHIHSLISARMLGKWGREGAKLVERKFKIPTTHSPE
jgi:hypothetical protein